MGGLSRHVSLVETCFTQCSSTIIVKCSFSVRFRKIRKKIALLLPECSYCIVVTRVPVNFSMFKLWNFSATLGRPTQEEKERKRKQREAQLQQIQRELTLDRKLVSGRNGVVGGVADHFGGGGHHGGGRPQRAKTFREKDTNYLDSSEVKYNTEVKYRPKKVDESQFVSRLRFFGDSPSPPLVSKRHSSAFLTPDDDHQRSGGPDLYGMRRRYTVAALDSEDTDFTTSTTGRANIVTFAASTPKLRFSDQAVDMSTTSGTNRSSHTSYGTSEDDDGFGNSNPSYRSASNLETIR